MDAFCRPALIPRLRFRRAEPSALCGRRRGVICAVSDRSRRDLELNWRYQDESSRRPVTCPDCGGSGEKECGWCHGTGVMMLGDRLVCSVDGTCHCLTCTGGYVKCKTCKGHGTVASWLLPS